MANRSPLDRSHSPQGWKNRRPDLQGRIGMGTQSWGWVGVPQGAQVGRPFGRGKLGSRHTCGSTLPAPAPRWTAAEPTRPGTGPREAPPAALPGRPRRVGGCAPPRSSPSRGSGGRSGAHSDGTHGSAGPAGAAVGMEGSWFNDSSPLGPRVRGGMRVGVRPESVRPSWRGEAKALGQEVRES